MIQPSEAEIIAVSDALVTLGLISFSPTERKYMSSFLQNYALELNNEQMISSLTQNQEAIESLKILNKFATTYQEHEIMEEFQEELNELLITINDLHGSISI